MKSVVITGSSTAIGRACALTLDRNGFRVFAGTTLPCPIEYLHLDSFRHQLEVNLVGPRYRQNTGSRV